MASKSEKTTTLRRRTLPIRPRVIVSRQAKRKPRKTDEVEIVFDDEGNAPTETDVLDDYLLASRDDASDEEVTSIKDKLIGSKAKLRALMHNSDDSGESDAELDMESNNRSGVSKRGNDELDDYAGLDGDLVDEEIELDMDVDENMDMDDNGENIDNGEINSNNPDVDNNGSDHSYRSTPTSSVSAKKPAKKTKNAPIKQKKNIKAATIKRGPGRPPKTQKKDPIPRKGIARGPHNPDSFIEVLYDQPIIMKKIFSFFKYVAASEIQILFRPRDIIFYAIDHNGKTKIRVRVDTEKLNHYYCRDVLDVGISQKEMEMVLNKVDKDYSSIVILSDVGTTRRNLTLVFENDIQIDELHRIDLIASYNKMENENAFIDEDYMIKFNFPGRYFKKTVGDIKSMSPQLSITQEDNESPLIFEYLTVNKRIQSKHTVKDSHKIKLESNLEDGESFRVDVCIDYLKPISASQISDDITILVDENKCLMTKSYIDGGTIEIKTLTEIIDERPDDDDDL